MSTASFNYTSIYNRMYNNLLQKADHADMSPYGTNTLLLEDIATEMAYEMQYDEYATMETRWGKARNKSSLVTQSSFHGFKIPRKIGARGTCRVSVSANYDESPAKNIPLNTFTTFSYADTKYIIIEDSLYTVNDTYCDVQVMQGEYKSYTYTAVGNKFEKIILQSSNIDNDFFFIYVNNVKVIVVDSLYDIDNTAYYCQIDSSPNLDSVIITFGDGTFGKQLVTGDTAYIQYVETKGKDGNLYSLNLIDTVDSNIYDVDSGLVTLNVKNITAISGGANEIDKEKLRVISPRFYQSGNRAGTVQDYITIINSFAYVMKANVWGSYEVNIDQNRDPWDYIATEDNLVYLCAVSDQGTDLTESQKLELVQDIYYKKPPTDILKYVDLDLINLKFYITAKIDDRSKTLPYMRSLITETLKDTYNIENFSFKENIYGSDVFALIDNLSGVRYADIQVLILKPFTFNAAYIGSFNATMTPISYSVCKVLMKHQDDPTFTQVGIVSNTGVITGLNGYDTTGSNIDLSKGSGVFKVNNILTKPYQEYSLYFEYNTAGSDNILLTNRNQIISYYDSEVSCLYFSGV